MKGRYEIRTWIGCFETYYSNPFYIEFSVNANRKRMLPQTKSLPRLRSLASKGVSLASPECNIKAGRILKKIQINK